MKKFTVLVIALLAVAMLSACAGSSDEVTRVVAKEVTREVVSTETVIEEGQEVEVTRLVVEEVIVQVPAEEAASEDLAAEPLPQVREDADQLPADMFFEEYGVNPFIDTEDDNLSTFAIDVDTGSYSIMRSYLEDGYLPPTEAIRTEEIVNYFDYGYAPPTEGAFAIYLEGAPTPYGESERYHLIQVGIQGYEVPREERPDALLIFVIDVSGSMNQGNRLDLVKQSLRLLVEELRPNDRVGIVVYGSNARVVLEPTYVDAESTILRAIDLLQPEGSTNAEQGIMVAYNMASQYAQSGQISRLILCSDGVANVGHSTAGMILDHAEEGISLSTFGFGMGNYNDILMEQLADQGDGSYAYIDTLDEAKKVFIDNLTGTLLTIAKDAKIQVEFNPAVVERYRLLGYENRAVADEDFRNDSVDAGEIGAGHSVTALYEVKFNENAARSDAAMTVRVRYEEPESGQIVEIQQATRLDQFHDRFEEASAYFQLAAAVAEYAEIMRDSFWAQNNDLRSLVVDVWRIAEYMPEDLDVQEFADLAAQAAILSD